MMAEIRDLMDADYGRALSLVGDAKNLAAGTDLVTDLEQLETCLENFDEDGAAKILEKILAAG